MASDALFQMLAQAKGQPSKALRATEAVGESGKDILGGYLQGQTFKTGMQEAALKPFEIWSKIAEQAGPDTANSVFKQRGIPVPDMGQPSTGTETPEQLVNKGKYGATKLGAQEKALTLTNNAPFASDVATAIGKGDVDALVKIHASRNEPVPFREMSQAIAAKTGSARGNYFDSRAGTMQLNELPSKLGPTSAAGAAYQVKVAARQGKTLIATPGSYQRLGLAQGDAARAVIRGSPTDEAMRNANFSDTLIGKYNAIKQKLNSDPSAIDQPLIRKELYSIFDEMDKSATPFIANHLQNMEANATNSTFGNNWGQVKQRELGLNLPEIPFNEGSAQNPNVPTGVPQYKYAKDTNGQRIRSSDGWATFEPVPQGQ